VYRAVRDVFVFALGTEEDLKAGKQSKIDLFPKATTTTLPVPVTPEIVDVAQMIETDISSYSSFHENPSAHKKRLLKIH
jgi:hypothetical protein